MGSLCQENHVCATQHKDKSAITVCLKEVGEECRIDNECTICCVSKNGKKCGDNETG
jgi:hypothetical protein